MDGKEKKNVLQSRGHLESVAGKVSSPFSALDFALVSRGTNSGPGYEKNNFYSGHRIFMMQPLFEQQSLKS